MLGVNAGAAVAIAIGVFSVTSISSYIWFAFVGAFIATVVVYVVSGGSGKKAPTLVQITLAGVALGAALSGLTTALKLLELFKDLNQQGNTLVVVLHDLNHAARYANHIIAMEDGQIFAQGDPCEIVTAQFIEEVFGLKCIIIEDPITHIPFVVPLGKDRSV